VTPFDRRPQETILIIDADTHFLPPDVYDYMGHEWAHARPCFTWDDNGLLVNVEFPGEPAPVPGATPLPPPGTGSRYRSAYYMDERLRDYEKLGIDQQFLFPSSPRRCSPTSSSPGLRAPWRTRGTCRY
jgi:hypothetical protein